MSRLQLPPLECGDTILVSDESFMASSIKWVTQSMGEPLSLVSHVIGAISPVLCSEALFRNTIHEFKPHTSKRTVIIYRPRHLSLEDKIKIKEYCYSVRDNLYGFWKLIPQLRDGLMMRFTGWDPMTRIANRMTSKYQLCHEHWALAMEHATGNKLFFGGPWWELNPDSMSDWCGTNPLDFELIFSHVKGE